MLPPWKATFLDLQRQVDEMFEQLIYRPWAISGKSDWRPALDIHETKDAFFIEIDLPQVAPDQLQLAAGERSLIISGRRELTAPEGLLSNRCERPQGVFQRIVELPHPIDAEKARAELREGACSIHLPKKAPLEKPPESAAHVMSESRFVIQIAVR